MRLTIIAAVLLCCSVAAAQAPGQTLSFDREAPPGLVPAPVTVSYRSQVLMADGAALGMILLAPAAQSEQLAALGVTSYFVAAPLVHLAHGRGGAAAKSLGLRTALPLAGAYVGYHLGPDDLVCASSSTVDGTADHGHCPGGSITGMLTGFIAGGVTAIVLDAKYFARYEQAAPTWTAGVQPARGGMTVALSGTF